MIQGAQLKNAIISGSNNIAKYRKQVNDLNIFPVPDGDTGSNMSMTIGAAAAGLKDLPDTCTVGEVAKKAASAMLRGARGNSGVILSLLFRGIAKGCEELDSIGPEELVRALDLGVEEAYKAVTRPTEGTILTVARVAAEQGRDSLSHGADEPVRVWDAVCQGAAKALEETPELLPVLKRAGVVDAGGQGLCLIFEGMLSVFRSGIILESGMSEEERAQETQEFFRNAAAEFDSEINFTYCTEFVIGRDQEISKDPLELRLFLETIGDCVLVADDEEIIKVHVHTEAPGEALQAGLQYGQLLTVKIDNMKQQHEKLGEAAVSAPVEPARLERQEPTEELGFISVAAGEGLKSLFLELGCAVVVSGGQTMNPSTEDILSAVLATPAKKVFVLPNNKNILMAAEQTIPLAEDREVIVLPTKTIPQGLSAMLAFDPDSSAEENQEAMLEAASHVDTGLVTFAARDSEFGSDAIRHGDILGLKNGKLHYIEKDPVATCVRVARSLATKQTSFITLIYGEGITAEQAQEAKRLLSGKVHSDVEINLVEGGQPVYYFIISVE
ncbi:DAK2 domain-containing protein [Acutalibacter sp. 1XD8-33]|uniref:DAK2 domain-containing protein n=1 Tax=Acutalibacter sp. 1XD8-33 TaxID=2320081 RepID=UPI000EA3836A|nr:DAK2 domain-containing protein [Acutalibacter sp. 1XD8-33]RKJ41233.1 DAK2 domain-containing protein [Acutalibacter sp. 1XD8-33]